MSSTTAEDPDIAVNEPPDEGAPITEETPILQADDTPSPPEIALYDLAGGASGATLSQLVKPDGSNIGEAIKARLVMAPDADALSQRIVHCLIAEFGMLQEDAEALVSTSSGPGQSGDHGHGPPSDEQQPAAEETEDQSWPPAREA